MLTAVDLMFVVVNVLRCILDPRLFRAVLEVAFVLMACEMEAGELSPENGREPLLDLRFAEDVF